MVKIVRLRVEASKMLFFGLRACLSEGSSVELLLEVVEKDGEKYLVGNEAQGVFEEYDDSKEKKTE